MPTHVYYGSDNHSPQFKKKNKNSVGTCPYEWLSVRDMHSQVSFSHKEQVCFPEVGCIHKEVEADSERQSGMCKIYSRVGDRDTNLVPSKGNKLVQQKKQQKFLVPEARLMD